MWQMYGHEFLTLALIHFMAVILPGPDFVITVRQSVRYGYLIGCLTAIGIGVGISVHVFSLYTTNFTEPLSYQDSAFLKLPKFP